MRFSPSQYVQMAALLQREAQQASASIPDKRKRLAGLAEASRQLAHRASEQIAAKSVPGRSGWLPTARPISVHHPFRQWGR
jgi:hypothetical protein